MNSTVIKPTIGRRVWFRPSAAFLANNPILTQFNPEQPMDAGIVYVHHDHMVNLIVTDHVGKTLAVPSVPLLAGHYVADEDTDVYCCCEWMPYQTGQSKKEHVVRIEPESEKFGLVSIDSAIEQQIQAAGADKAPRVTPFEVEAHIRSEFYFTAEQGVLGESELGTRPASWTNLDQVTICVLILTNGTTIVGVNEGPVSRENFKADLGRQYARQKAVDQIWPLLGFRLRDELARPVLTDADAAASAAR